MATEDRNRTQAGASTPSEWRAPVLSGLALLVVAATAWLAVPAGHPLQAGVAVGLIYSGLMLPTATYLYLRETAQQNGQERASTAVEGLRARLARLTGRVTRSRWAESTRTCSCKP
ncbi:hypothetical protein [Haloarchaeobius sp. HME9146]|uniref:hypothetical protein n=1 Tax=Haloarchaeobius sp. HME9146 TaxID=2978732 RepID=UPI0021C13652|nr:hypothetical protein [Haloarchaeobius sp. HME9146]MCT9094830.1 hypothetical protein [Haloarchaeobius sp. HME9146]